MSPRLPSVGSRVHWRWCALALTVLGLLGGWAWSSRQAARVPGPVAPLSVSALPERPASPGPVPAAPASASSLQGPAVPEGHVEVCGRAPIPQAGDSPEQQEVWDAELARMLAPEYRHWLASALQHEQARVRAAGRVLAALQAWGDAAAVHAGTEGARQACRGDAACERRVADDMPQRERTDLHGHLDALARLALETRDRAIYGLAAQLCAAKPLAIGTACQQVSLAEWARLEPDNMAAWLRLADEAHARKDLQARAQALHRAAAARRHTHHEGLLVEAIEATGVPDLHPYTLQQSYASVAAVHRVWLASFGDAATAECAPPMLHDANRRQACRALAAALTERGSSLLDDNLGRAIGERAGWPPERLDALREERLLINEVGARATVHANPLGCPAVDAMRQYFQGWARRGELAALRALAASATPEERERARVQARRAREAAAPASAAR